MAWSWPSSGLTADVRPLLARALAAGEPAALATLVAAEGAAPLGVGAQMAFAGEDRCGFLSGGCVEGDVALQAEAVLADGAPRRPVYGRGGPPDIRLLCGSRIELLVERLAPEAVRRLITLGEARRPALWLTDGRRQAAVAEGEAAPPSLAAAEAEAARRADPAGWAGESAFRRYDPRPRLVLIGGDPIALALARLAADAELEVALVRPKGPAEPPPAPGVRYLRDEPGAALAALGLDPWTAVAALSHDLDQDHEALTAALPSPAAFVGVLGSRRRIPERQARLAGAGLTPAEINRLTAPIGLDIGARSPFEIAVSILAEVIQAFRAQEARRRWPSPAFMP